MVSIPSIGGAACSQVANGAYSLQIANYNAKSANVDNKAKKAAIFFCYKSPENKRKFWNGLSSSEKENLIYILKSLTNSPYLPVRSMAEKVLCEQAVVKIYEEISDPGARKSGRLTASEVANKIAFVTRNKEQDNKMIEVLSAKLSRDPNWNAALINEFMGHVKNGLILCRIILTDEQWSQ